MVKKIERAAAVTNAFATLYPLIKSYLATLFGTAVDLEDDNIRRFLANPVTQDRIATFLGRKLGEVVTEQKPLTVEASPIRLSQTAPFLWRRQHQAMDKTIFNEVATFNPFETSFARFLADKCKDVPRFAALAETFHRLLGRLPQALGRYRPVLPRLGGRAEGARRRGQLDRRDQGPGLGRH